MSEAATAPPREPVEAERAAVALKYAAAAGVKWTSLAYLARTGIHLLTTSVFAWLLAPADFGLVGMAMVVVGFTTLCKDLGTGAAVVQRKEIDDETLSSIFWANTALGVAGCGLLFALAGPIAGFFREPRLTPVLEVLALTLLFSGPGVVHLAVLQRRLRFAVLARIEIAALVVGSGAGLAAAFSGQGVWSLVLMTVTVSLFTSGFALLASPFRPHPVCRPGHLRSVARFSLNLTGFQVFSWLTRNVDHLLIGRFLGATRLGYYALAYRLVLYPLQGAARVVGRVMFPLLSSIQDDHPRFRNAYLKVTHAIATVLFPAMAGLFLVSRPLVETVFGARWLPAVPLIAIFALVSVLQSVGGTVAPIYQAKGRTDLLLRWGLLAGSILVAGIAVGLRWGTVGAAAGFGAASVALFYPSLAIPFRLIDLKVAWLARALWRPAAATLAMTAAILGLSGLLEGPHLALQVAAGVAAYAAAILVLDAGRTREVAALLLGRGRPA
ncbi:MAG: MOP flippase family protein [Planctomycetota bacterium]